MIREVFDFALFPPSDTPDLTLLWILAGVMVGVAVVTGVSGLSRPI